MADKQTQSYTSKSRVELITHQKQNVKTQQDILTIKKEKNLKIGCWNVRSLGNSTEFNTSLRNVIATMEKNNVIAMALSKVRWSGCSVLEVENATVVYSGSADKHSSNRRGTAVVLIGYLRTAWKEKNIFFPINDRLLKIRLKLGKIWLSIISVYAPTKVSDPSTSDKFYFQLQHTVKGVNHKYMLLVLGDFNARVSPAIKPTELHRAHNPNKCNNNGERLLDFCKKHGLVITNTVFPHKKIHQWSWTHPNQKERKHVLDYILVNQKFRASIFDTRTHISDHNPVVSKIRIDYKRQK